ncbi:hypothetical protein D3C87_1756730 [compost metagenome]
MLDLLSIEGHARYHVLELVGSALDGAATIYALDGDPSIRPSDLGAAQQVRRLEEAVSRLRKGDGRVSRGLAGEDDAILKAVVGCDHTSLRGVDPAEHVVQRVGVGIIGDLHPIDREGPRS